MDLVVAMAPFVDEVTMTKTFELIRSYLEVQMYSLCLIWSYWTLVYLWTQFWCVRFQTKEPGMQKKAYRVLEEMCGGERDECKSFVVTNLETLKGVLLGTLKNASSPAKRVRLSTWRKTLN